MNAIRTTAAIAALALSVGAASAAACMGSPTPERLPATLALASALKSTYLAAHHGVRSVRVTRTHYGTIMGDWYAVASFTANGHTTKPTIFVRHHHSGPWHIARVTHGAVCGRYVPVPLIELWTKLHRLPNTDCYVERTA